MGFKGEARKYFVLPPFMSNRPGVTPDLNAVLYTGTYLVITKRLGLKYSQWDYSKIEKLLDDVTIEPGLISRGNGRKDRQSHDDYIGLAAALYVMEYYAQAQDFYNYGKRHWWVFKNVPERGLKTMFRSWFARLPGVVQLFKVCGAKELGLLDQCLFALDLVWSTRSETSATSGRILDWLKAQAYRKRAPRYRICDWAISRWEKDIRARYPGLMGDVFGIYFSPEHPFSKYMQGLI